MRKMSHFDAKVIHLGLVVITNIIGSVPLSYYLQGCMGRVDLVIP